MLVLFGILVIIASVILGLIVLIQNPKGGGLSSSFGGFGNQIMGVKQTTDVLEKGTWLFAAIIGVLCLVSTVFISDTAGTGGGSLEKVPTSQPVKQTPANNSTPTLPATTPAK